MDVLPQRFRVPEIYGAYWFNSDPIPLGALRGYVVLVEFWDYTSQSCAFTLPYTKEWHKRYSGKGLVTIGIHTPQFPFGADPLNVRAEIERRSIRYPVMMDNDFIAWGAFRNSVWPTKYLVDKNGFIRYVHAGEGSYQNFEHAIQSLLNEAGYHADFPLVMEPLRDVDRPGAVCYRATPEILAGWQRGTIGNVEGAAPESTVHYEDPGIYLEGRIYLHGNWMNGRNAVRFEAGEGGEGRLIVSYQAKEVNAVIRPEGEKKFQVFVRQDGAWLRRQEKGDDVRFDEEGRSFLVVADARLSSIVRNKEFGSHTLALSMRSSGFALYGLSFVSSVIPEMITNN